MLLITFEHNLENGILPLLQKITWIIDHYRGWFRHPSFCLKRPLSAGILKHLAEFLIVSAESLKVSAGYKNFRPSFSNIRPDNYEDSAESLLTSDQ